MDDQPKLYRPLPRRAFELTPASPDSPGPTTPRQNSDPFDAAARGDQAASNGDLGSSSNFSRTRSILNLTTSTLFGIYSPTDFDAVRDPDGPSEPATPWGTGAETPARRGSVQGEPDGRGRAESLATKLQPELRRVASQQRGHLPQKRGFRGFVVPLAARLAALFAIGVAYGVVVSQLHSAHDIVPVRVEGIPRGSLPYYLFWGVCGVGLGSALPWVDWLWADGAASPQDEDEDEEAVGSERPGKGVQLSQEWNPVVRSVGAFVGIAFAIRKLHWQSTLQVSVTLALVNPALWYLLDRSKPGFTLSSVVGIAGTALLLLINPDWVPSPAQDTVYPSAATNVSQALRGAAGGEQPELLAGVVSYESVGVATWIASVLFCSSVCFGNIGRKLVGAEGTRRWRP